MKCQTSFQPLCFLLLLLTAEPLLPSPRGTTPTSRHATHLTPHPHPTSSQVADMRGRAGALLLSFSAPSFSLSFHLLLPRQESLSHLCAAELWVRTQHRAHGSLISPTSDHSSRSSRQNYFKSSRLKKK